MENVILVIHLILAVSIIGLVLLQRSEGGGLGIGGGGLGGLASPKGAANALTRATAICAAAFFCTSLILGVISSNKHGTDILMDTLNNEPAALERAIGEDKQEQETSGETPAEAPVAPIAQ